MTQASRFRDLLSQDGMIVAPGAYDCITAKLIEQAGFAAVYMTGAGTAASLGYPDFGLVTMSEMVANAGRLVTAVGVPVIADADTGHGGDPHVRNLIRRFVEAGVPGYHIEDQRPGTKKCGHQGGKVLVAQDEQNKRLNAARFQLDVMGVPGIIVARTDAEAANQSADERECRLLRGRSSARDTD